MPQRRGAQRADIEAIYRDRFAAFAVSATALLRDSDAALEVVQEGFARALRRRRSFRGEGSLEAWIWRIVLNLARDRQRAAGADRAHMTRELREDASTPPDDSVRARLRALPERQRIAVFLRYYGGMSYEEIADLMGTSEDTARANVYQGTKKLREMMR